MARPVSRLVQTFADYGSQSKPNGETATVQLWVTTVIAGNYAAEQAKHAALFLALNDVTVGTSGSEIKRTTVVSDVIQASGPNSSPLSQRENKWLLRYHDANDNKFQAEVPCADLSILATNSEFMSTADPKWTALKTAFEAVVVSPIDQSAVTLDSAQFVGRRL